MPAKKSSSSTHSECFDYEEFVPQLKKNRCIWDPRDENYNLGEYRNLAFSKIEKALQLRCKLFKDWLSQIIQLKHDE